MIRPWHLEIRHRDAIGDTVEAWWVTIVGGNGETVFATETYNRAEHARDIADATAQTTGWTITPAPEKD